jgi:hypothetical protein
MIPAAELAQIQRDLVAAACDQSCVIQHKTTTAGPTGEPLSNWATTATTVAGLRMPTASELANYAYAIEDKAAWTVLLPIATVVSPQDHLLIGGQTLEVHILLAPRSYPGCLAVIAAEVKP